MHLRQKVVLLCNVGLLMNVVLLVSAVLRYVQWMMVAYLIPTEVRSCCFI